MRNSGTFGPGDPRAGRPKGARTRLTTTVFEDILAHWNEPAAPNSKLRKGQEVLQTLYVEKPGEYARLVISTLPKEFLFEQTTSDMSDDQIDDLIVAFRQRIIEQRAAAPLPAPKVIEHDDRPRH